jgi:hypothetical protein
VNAALALAAPAPAAGGWLVVVAAVVTALGGSAGLAALALVASQRRKNDAETRKHSADGATALTSAAVGLIKPLEERLARSESDNDALRGQLVVHERRADGQVATIGEQRREIRALRALLARILQVVTAPTATADPASAVGIVRDLVTTVDPTENGR